MDEMKLEEKLLDLKLEKILDVDEIPQLDLYMDQVIQIFESKFNDTNRNEDDKILTKTMINNYAKGKILPPIKNKKYSKKHILILSLIYQLKGSLSISDIKTVLNTYSTDDENVNDQELEMLYNAFIKLYLNNIIDFKQEVFKQYDTVKKVKEEIKEERIDEQVLLINSLVSMSNMYRRLAEKLVDDYAKENNFEDSNK